MTSIDEKTFGLHVRFVAYPAPGATTLSPWPWIAHGAIRIWNAYVAWYDVNPAPGVWTFERLDKIVDMVTTHGVRPLIVLGRTPTWASARPDEPSKAMPGSGAEPADFVTWDNYVREVATRYRGRVEGYEIWNEPGFSDFEEVLREDGSTKQYFSGTAYTMATLTRRARFIIKDIDPDALIVSPSVTCEADGLGRLEAFLGAGGGQWCDVIGYHFYQPYPEDMVEEAQALRALLSAYGLAQPIWDTEIGYILDDEDTTPIDDVPERTSWATPISPTNAGILLARSHLLHIASGVERVYWYTWDHDIDPDPMGLSASGTELNAQGTAYAKVQSWLVGATLRNVDQSLSGLWRLDFARGATPFTVVWREWGEEDVATTPTTTVEPLFGMAQISDGRPMRVGQEPVLMVEQG